MSTIVQRPLAPHFDSPGQQRRAARMGIWLFLVAELLSFAGIFVACVSIKVLYPEMWSAAADQLNLGLGTVNTMLLITSAFAGAVALRQAKTNVGGENNKQIAGLLFLTVAFGVVFLGGTAMELMDKADAGLLPGARYAFQGIEVANPHLFFGIWWLAVVLHAAGVALGVAIAFLLIPRAAKGHFHRGYHAPLELGAGYVQLMALVWFFLFPLLYLV